MLLALSMFSTLTCEMLKFGNNCEKRQRGKVVDYFPFVVVIAAGPLQPRMRGRENPTKDRVSAASLSWARKARSLLDDAPSPVTTLVAAHQGSAWRWVLNGTNVTTHNQ